MKVNKELRWLAQVRQELLKINYCASNGLTKYRKFLFKKPLKLDHESWLSYFRDGYTPLKAVREDCGLPIVKMVPKTIIY